MTTLGCGASGTIALAFLLQLPGLPNCPAIFWPLASASIRFECARIAASKQTTNDLLEAISLVDSLPPDHPMREEADRLVELWSKEVLDLAEKLFHAGKLPEAVAAARRIPTKVSAYKLVDDRVKLWQKVWAEAEAIYRQAEDKMRDLNWRLAFNQAVKLLEVDNQFWQTTKYDELIKRITVAREEGNKLARAERLGDRGGLNNLLEAIKLAESISENSYVYEAARGAIRKFGRSMLVLAEDRLERRDLSGALAIVSKIPDSANLKEVTKDFIVLANAQAQVWQNTVVAIEEAISQAQRLDAKRPLYRKAQKLIARWQLEVEAVAQLERARTYANPGTIEDLATAIAEAAQVPRSNPRWEEAQQQIQRWKAQIETIQDQPILDQAEQMASGGDVSSLQAAIAQAEQIGQGRALSQEARRKIRTWSAQIQQTQDQPILDQAREIASAGDLPSAIGLAQQIRAGRALYDNAQADIRTWKKQIQAARAREAAAVLQAQVQQALQQAQELANAGSTGNLAEAIQLASQIPSSSPAYTEASNAINEWSRQLLQAARSQAEFDTLGAIDIAQKIPARASTYREAQTQIQTWSRGRTR